MIPVLLPRRRALIAVLVALALTVAACGSDDEPVDRRDTLSVRLDEYRISPQEVRVQAGRLRVIASNEGVLTHNLSLQSVDGEDEQGDALVALRTDTAHPGETVRDSAVLLPGRYRMVCTIANHDDLGQYGTLEAVAAR